MPAPHPLSALLAPSSVAIFGASNDPTRISGRSLRYYREAVFVPSPGPDSLTARTMASRHVIGPEPAESGEPVRRAEG